MTLLKEREKEFVSFFLFLCSIINENFFILSLSSSRWKSSFGGGQKDSKKRGYICPRIIETRETFSFGGGGTRVCSKFTRNAAKLVDAFLKCTRAPHARTPPTSFACKLFARASNGRRARQPKCNMCSSFCRPVPRTFESLHKVAKLPLKLCARYLDGICQMWIPSCYS